MRLKLSVLVIGLFVAWGLLSPATLGHTFDVALSEVTRRFGWLYLWIVLGLVVLAFWLALSRFGQLKLGDEDELPAFSLGAWFAMLFAAGMGIGLVFWGVGEPLSHYGTPPPGIAPRSPEAANAAMRYSFFHWGLHPWAVYSVVGLSIAFFQMRRNAPTLVSASTASLPWTWVQRLSPLFDVLAIVATAFGVAASLGIGALQINSGLHRVVGMPVGPAWQVGIIVVATVLFVVSAVSGVERGVKWLSSANLVVAAALALAVALLGPTVRVVDTFTTTLGSYLSEFVRMSLRTTPFRDDTWVGSWTIFYWAWWISWSPFVGMFIARVSRGRTIREFVAGTVFAPAIAGALWFSIFGGSALSFEIFGHAPLAAAAKADVSTALFVLFDQLPMSGLLSIVATLLVLVFFVTSGDSATLVLGIMSGDGDPDPKPGVKALWGALVAGIAICLLLSGGVQAVQTATIVFALPFAFVIVLMAIALVRGVHEDWHAHELRERALHRRLRDLTDGASPRTGTGTGTGPPAA